MSIFVPDFCHTVAVAANSGGGVVKRRRRVGEKAKGRRYTYFKSVC